MYTYQDFMDDYAKTGAAAIGTAISKHCSTEEYRTAIIADDYDKQRNTTIRNYVKWLYSENGQQRVDQWASNHKLTSNFFNRLNVQRMTYSLGNGLIFDDPATKDALGKDIDTRIHTAGYYALIHGVSFLFKNLNNVDVFKITEFVPLWDEETGSLRAGIRFWQIDARKPLIATLYEEDGYTVFSREEKAEFQIKEEKRAYIVTASSAPVDATEEITWENYNAFPIVPLYGSRLHQSTLVGMRGKIDAYDLILSGFCNDLADCSQVYWLISGAGGATEEDMARFRAKLKFEHIASVPNSGDVAITPYTQEIPYSARKELLQSIKESIYEDFGALDVHQVSADSTNDHLQAAYQPMDENADDYEYQIIVAVQALLALDGVTDVVPSFKRNKVTNIKEETEVVLMCAPYLTDDLIRAKLPILSSDEVEAANETAFAEGIQRITTGSGDE